jgi:ATP-dependent helicase HrpA
LPVASKTSSLYAAIESQERLRGDLVDAALNALRGVDIAGILDIAASSAADGRE